MTTSKKFLADYNPWLINAIGQGGAGLISLILFLLIEKGKSSIGYFHPAMIVLAVAFVGINYAYSALYSQGVALSYVPLIVTGSMTILLGLVGHFFFQELITRKFVLGAIIAVFGMRLMIK